MGFIKKPVFKKMSFKIIIKKEAQFDLDEAIIWYEEQRIGLGLELVFEFDKTVQKITINPFYASCILADARSASLKTFPYEIVYRIDEIKKQVRIIAFSHQKRKPNWFVYRNI